MSAFIFENRRVICKLLTYRYIHIFYVFVLRNMGFSAVPLIDSLGYSHISFYVSIMVLLLTPISIFLHTQCSVLDFLQPNVQHTSWEE